MKVVLKDQLRAQHSDILAKISTNNPYVGLSKKLNTIGGARSTLPYQ